MVLVMARVMASMQAKAMVARAMAARRVERVLLLRLRLP
jgi:hypothetical protein